MKHTVQKHQTTTEAPEREKPSAAAEPASANHPPCPDLAARQPVEPGLPDSEGWARTAFENGAIAMALTSLESRLLKVNSVFCRLLGFSEAELVGRSFAEVTHPDDRAASLVGMQQLRRGEVPSFRMEKRYLRKDGTVLWGDMGAAVVRDPQGVPRYFVTHIQDISERKQAEAALLASERQATALVNAITEPLLLIAPEGTILAVNPAMARRLQQSPADLLGQNIYALLPAELARRRKARAQEVLRSGRPLRFDDEREGTVLDSHVYPELDAEGKVRALVVFAMDVTARRRAEAAVRQSEELHRVSFELAAVGMAYVSPEGLLLKVNDQYCAITGYSRAELTGRSVHELTHPDDRPRDHEEFVRYAQGTSPVYATEKRYLRKDGSVCWVAVTARMVHDAAGRPRHSIGIVTDITERKQAEAALRDSERRLNRSQEIAHLGSWELDLKTDRLTWSDEVYRIFGLPPQQFGATYQAFLEAVHPDDRRAVDAAYSGSLREGRDTYEIEHRVLRKGTGELRIVQEKCEHLRDAAGRIVRSVGIIHDITERRQAEQALAGAKAALERQNQDLEQRVSDRTAKLQRALAEMEHFSYAIVHDMRAPLRALRGFAELAERECPGSQHALTRGYLDRIKTAALRMDDLIRDSLSYSKAVREELPLRPVDPGHLLHDLVQTYPHLHPEQAEIQLEGAFPLVLGNEAALTQCLGNLLGNAVKFAKPGAKPHIRVWAETVQDGAALLCATGGAEAQASRISPPAPAAPPSAPPAGPLFIRLWVEDHGIGIPKDSQQRIFDMFQRGTNDQEGTGIGLAIVRKLVQRMGGKVGVESHEGQGSRFWVELPAPHPAAKPGA